MSATPPVNDPENPTYWDPTALQSEVKRVFQVCEGCRKCYDKCEVFPRLFRFFDGQNTTGVEVPRRQTHKAMNSCFQCQLCDVGCPNSVRENHELQVDFPKLVQRYQAQQMGKDGSPTAREKLLTDIYQTRRKSRSMWGRFQGAAWFRKLASFFYGLDPQKKWPVFAEKTFSELCADSGNIKPPSEDLEAVFFSSCTIDTINPAVGQDALFVLRTNGVQVACAKGLGCCGLPEANLGSLTGFREKAQRNIERLLPYVESGAKILVATPSCALTMKTEYLRLLPVPWRQKAQKIAAATTGVADYLWKRRTREDFAEKRCEIPFSSVAYHISCHQRALDVKTKGRDLLKKVAEVNVAPVLTCCGQGGSHAFKTEFYQSAKDRAARARKAMTAAGAPLWLSDCPMADLQFTEQGTAKVMHPLSFLANCYRDDGFHKK